jgi:hypothetical protein
MTMAKPTSSNKRVALTALFGRFGFRKTPVGLAPFVVFCSATVWAGVVAAQLFLPPV